MEGEDLCVVDDGDGECKIGVCPFVVVPKFLPSTFIDLKLSLHSFALQDTQTQLSYNDNIANVFIDKIKQDTPTLWIFFVALNGLISHSQLD